MRKLNKAITTICAAAFMAAALLISAFAASATEQMAANSAAWWVAHNAGDTATCNALHAANEALAAQAAGSGGSANYNANTGSWAITQAGGQTITSSSYGSGKSTVVNYGAGGVSVATGYAYDAASIAAYYASGGTKTGLEQSYNNAAAATVEADANGVRSYYDQSTGKVNYEKGAQIEADVMKELLGLTDTEASALQKDLLNAKQGYNEAREKYDLAMQSGNKDAAAKAKAEMTKFHDAAESVRNTYGYTGDVEGASDGGFFTGGNSSMPNAIPGGVPAQGGSVTPGGGVTPGGADEFIVDPTKVVRTYNITVSCGAGGTANPTGKVVVKQDSDQTITFTPDKGYKISSVTVDGVNKGSISSYTFTKVSSAHSISAQFIPSGVIELDMPVTQTATGMNITSGAIKSGYGIMASARTSYSDVTNVRLTLSYNFGDGAKTVTLEETASGRFEFPVNSASPTGARCVYIPVGTADGTYTLTYTMTAKNAASETLTKTRTATLTVRGNMYEDDVTADS